MTDDSLELRSRDILKNILRSRPNYRVNARALAGACGVCLAVARGLDELGDREADRWWAFALLLQMHHAAVVPPHETARHERIMP